MNGAYDPAYVQARRVLLDALTALEAHLDSIILIGAQAVYVHAGEADLAVAPYTTDADLALDADSLTEEPRIESAMETAGFVRRDTGSWRGAGDVGVDLMVPEMQGGPGRRAARIPPHHRLAARKVHGIEGALVDRGIHPIEALDDADTRRFEIRVAGPAALIVAKLIKIDERRDDAGRVRDKDALDVLRLLRAVETSEIAERLDRIVADDRMGALGRRALDLLSDLFGSPDGLGCAMTVAATESLEDPEEITASCVALARDLLEAVQGSGSR